VSRHGPLSDAPLRALGAALADALVTIHTAGVVHRDLTPRNVVLGPDGPRVVDFGIAWYEGAPAITRTGTRVGTPAWMPPERLSGDVVTAAGDVWSWGAVMAYAARGRPVVTGSSPEIVAHRILVGEADLAGVPDWLDAWVRAALSPDPTARPAPTGLLAAMTAAPSSPIAAAGADAARQRTEVAHEPLPTQASDADPTRVQDAGAAGAGGAAGDTVPAGAPPESLPGIEPTVGAGAAAAGPAGPAGRRRLARRVSAVVILGAAAAVGWLAGLLPIIIVTAVLFMAAIALRLAQENDPRHARPIPPTWAVGLAAFVVLAVGLMRAFGLVAGAAALIGLVVLFFLLGGDIT
jgi:eukaryotic-like serine/threonine-protein kinase